MVTLIPHMLQKLDVYHLVPEDPYLRFLDKLRAGYNPMPYHNKTHATDLAQGLFYFLINGLQDRTEFSNIRLLGMITAAACHDFEHPGF